MRSGEKVKKEIDWPFIAGVACHTVWWTFKYLWKFLWIGFAGIIFLITILGLSVNKSKQDNPE
jgi:hypothetical protein